MESSYEPLFGERRAESEEERAGLLLSILLSILLMMMLLISQVRGPGSVDGLSPGNVLTAEP